MKKTSLVMFALSLLVLISLISQASALFVNSVNLENTLYPGEESSLRISLYNEFDYDIEEISFVLDFTNTPFTTIGSSEKSLDEIKDDESGIVSFIIKASNSAKPGDYNVPYTLTYKNLTVPKKGTIGILVGGKTELEFLPSVENPVIGEKGKLSLNIINKGSGDARFVTVKISPEGYTLLSDKEIYIGTIPSDESETADFDVVFDREKIKLNAEVEYTDLENKKSTESISLPITVYSKEKALELGLITKSNTKLYIILIIGILIIWFIWRKIKKKRKQLNLSQRK